MNIEKKYKKITQGTYALIAEEFEKRDRLTVAESGDVARALQKFARLVRRGGRVLDIGCGIGRDSMVLTKNGFQVLGIDFSKKMIDFARKRNPQQEYRVMDLEKIKFKEKFDGIQANASLHHIPKSNLPAALRRIYAFLRGGGIFFIKVKHGNRDGLRTNFNYGMNITRYFAYYKVNELQKILRKAGFEIVSAKTTTKREWVDIFARK